MDKIDGPIEVEVLDDGLDQEEKDRRIANGFKIREEMAKKLRAGLSVSSHYRAQWIRTGVTKVFEAIEAHSHEFNSQHDDDRISALDVLDVLNTAQAWANDAVVKLDQKVGSGD